jgi:lysophospholipase L1-like esterase
VDRNWSDNQVYRTLRNFERGDREVKKTLLFSAAIVLGIIFCAGVLLAASQTPLDPDGTPHNAKLDQVMWQVPSAKMKLVLVGDSTVQDSSGWGPGFEAMLKPGIECINLARGGRSSKSYREEGRWAQAISLKPTYIILGFSHNDIHKDKPERYASLEDFRANIKRFVDEAKAAGIKPVLMTSMAERKWDKDGKFEDTAVLMPYEQATRDVAKEEGVPLLDLSKATTDFYIQKGEKAIDADSPLKNGKIDNSHLNHQGAIEVGQLVAEQAKATVPELAPYIQ